MVSHELKRSSAACVSGSAAGLGKTSSTTARAAAASGKDAADFFTGNATNSSSVGDTGTAVAVMANMAMAATEIVRAFMMYKKWECEYGAFRR